LPECRQLEEYFEGYSVGTGEMTNLLIVMRDDGGYTADFHRVDKDV